MNNLHYSVLKFLKRRPRSKDCLKKKFKKVRADRLEDVLDSLEDNLFIEEATTEELNALKNNLPFPDSDSGILSGFYFLREEGYKVIEEHSEETLRFYLPFCVTTVISVISLVVSIVSLATALAD